jgi:hypothetical protein
MARVQSHLDTCVDCRQRLDEFRELSATLRALPETPPPRSFALTPEQAGAIEHPRPAAVPGRLYPALRSAAAAAAVLLFAVIGADVFLRLQEEPVAEPQAALMGRQAAEDLQEFEGGVAATGEANVPPEGERSAEEDKALTGETPGELTPPVPAVPMPADGEDEAGFAATPSETPQPDAYAEATGAEEAGAEADEAEADDERPWLFVLEVGLGVGAVGLLGAALLLRRRRVV